MSAAAAAGARPASRWPRPVVAIVAAGVCLRALALALSWSSPLDGDAREYELLARRYSFAHPFSASFREPLWRALVKVATGPFGYGAHSARVFTTLVSIATLPLAWLLLRRLVRRRGVPERAAVVALAIVALSAQTTREAPRGLREDLCLLLFLVFAALLLGRPGPREALLLALPVGVLSVVRWELATFATALAVLWALARRLPPVAPLLCAAAVAVASGPWLLANRSRHGALFYNTEVHSTYYWKQEQPASVRQRFRSPIAADPPVHLSWSTYYLHYLGPLRSVERFAVGYPKVAAKLLAAQVVPRSAAVAVLGDNQRATGWLAAMAAVGLVALAALAAAARRLARVAAVPGLLPETLTVLLLSIAPYAALASLGLELRVLLFAVPLLALAAGIAVDLVLAAPPTGSRRGAR